MGTALGDALGLPCEGLSSRVIARRFAPLDHFALIGDTGFVSDDTEQSALIAQALCERGDEAMLRNFRRSLLGWFLRLPFGIGVATIRASVRLLLGLKRSGVYSAGNGAAMRSAIIGVCFDHRPERTRIARLLAEVTHTDPRAVEAAVFCADVAANEPTPIQYVNEPTLRAALLKATALAHSTDSVEAVATVLGTSGFVLQSVPFAWFCFQRFGASFNAVQQAISAGGDTDTNAAIVGAWVGSRAPHVLPGELIERLAPGPFGPRHLRALAQALAEGAEAPRFAWPLALLRNVALFPVVLAHGFRRLIPW